MAYFFMHSFYQTFFVKTRWSVIMVSCLCFASCSPGAAETNPGKTSETVYPIPAADRLDLYLDKIRHKNIGLVVNHTSTIQGVHLVDSLLSMGISVKKIFSPEHGFKGRADAGEKVSNEMYLNKIPIISLYGNKRKPSVDDLEGLDLIIYDMQDVGVRFYTYISTLHYVMEAAANSSLAVMVLDRPSPNGHYVDGPVLLPGYTSFVGMHPSVPVVYGMTVGEYARMINGEGWLAEGLTVDLEVIPCKNYDHQKPYDLPIPPSPNLPNARAVLLYPSLCFFEGTTFSVGRGTEMQFQIFGHPDYGDTEFSFEPVSRFGAKYPKHEGQTCTGRNLQHLSPEEIRSWGRLNLSYLLEAYQRSSEEGIEFFNKNNFFEKLSGSDTLRNQILAGWTEAEIRASWQNDLQDFMKIREKYLIYP